MNLTLSRPTLETDTSQTDGVPEVAHLLPTEPVGRRSPTGGVETRPSDHPLRRESVGSREVFLGRLRNGPRSNPHLGSPNSTDRPTSRSDTQGHYSREWRRNRRYGTQFTSGDDRTVTSVDHSPKDSRPPTPLPRPKVNTYTFFVWYTDICVRIGRRLTRYTRGCRGERTREKKRVHTNVWST